MLKLLPLLLLTFTAFADDYKLTPAETKLLQDAMKVSPVIVYPKDHEFTDANALKELHTPAKTTKVGVK
jgi:hypothetical protein